VCGFQYLAGRHMVYRCACFHAATVVLVASPKLPAAAWCISVLGSTQPLLCVAFRTWPAATLCIGVPPSPPCLLCLAFNTWRGVPVHCCVFYRSHSGCVVGCGWSSQGLEARKLTV
jgi:hypothetical protein